MAGETRKRDLLFQRQTFFSHWNGERERLKKRRRTQAVRCKFKTSNRWKTRHGWHTRGTNKNECSFFVLTTLEYTKDREGDKERRRGRSFLQLLVKVSCSLLYALTYKSFFFALCLSLSLSLPLSIRLSLGLFLTLKQRFRFDFFFSFPVPLYKWTFPLSLSLLFSPLASFSSSSHSNLLIRHSSPQPMVFQELLLTLSHFASPSVRSFPSHPFLRFCQWDNESCISKDIGWKAKVNALETVRTVDTFALYSCPLSHLFISSDRCTWKVGQLGQGLVRYAKIDPYPPASERETLRTCSTNGQRVRNSIWPVQMYQSIYMNGISSALVSRQLF